MFQKPFAFWNRERFILDEQNQLTATKASLLLCCNMKKYIIILLMLVYGLPSTGASLYLHYCCGKLDAVSFSVQHKEGCTQKEADSKTCCNNFAIDLKLDADQQPFAPWIHFLPAATAPVTSLPVWQITVPFTEVLINTPSTGPPVTASSPPVYLKNCLFRI